VASLWQNLIDKLRPRRSRRPAARPAGAPRTGAAARPGPPPGRHLDYAPRLDGRADPGEIVWTWVPYEEDHSQGKDRPVLVVGRDRATLYGLMLSSSSARDGQRNWYALGAGAWDGQHRPSWLRLDRVLEVNENGIRREGAVLDPKRFNAVAGTLRAQYGWH
jgi:PemK-like, MazF-like toxin of type II toxin-antitoxin system